MDKIVETVYELSSLDGMDYRNIKLDENKEIVNRWGQIRMLDGLDDDMFDKCALSYERMAVYLINEYKGDGDERALKFIHLLAFPCVRCVVNTLRDDIMPEMIVNELARISKWFNDDIVLKFKEILGDGFDFEAEMCSYVSDSIVARLIRNGKYKVTSLRTTVNQ